MKVLVITYYWPPSGGAGVQRWLKFVKYLPAYGVEPLVLTIDPRVAIYPVRDESLASEVNPSLKVFKTSSSDFFSWYKRFNGTRSVPFSGFANEGSPTLKQKISRFVRGNFLLPDARRGWNRHAFSLACRLMEEEHPDLVVTTGPPHSTHLLGLKLKKRYKIPWLADFRDPWTDIYYYRLMYPTCPARRYDRWLERRVLESSDGALTVSKDLKRLFLEKSALLNPERIFVLPNGFDREDFPSEVPDKESVFTITYTGTLSSNYPTKVLLEVLRKMKSEFLFRMRFLGKVDPEVKQSFLDALGNFAFFTPHVPHAEAVKALMTSHLLLLIIPDIPDNKGILTGKLFEYVGSGVPVIALGPVNGDAAEILSGSGVGRVFEYRDFSGIERFIHEVMSGHFSVGEAHSEKFERKYQTGMLAEMMNSLIHLPQ
jgi:glycosyltransferase involved in cell wall biosynthesis